MACKKDHSQIQRIMATLPTDQGGVGRHKCAACAYEAGYEAGYNLNGLYHTLKKVKQKHNVIKVHMRLLH